MMGYFSNATESDIYHGQFCAWCLHNKHRDCPIWALHQLHNYEECNKPGSFLHVLIPRAEDGPGNEQCAMFIALDGKSTLPGEVQLTEADEALLAGEARA